MKKISLCIISAVLILCSLVFISCTKEENPVVPSSPSGSTGPLGAHPLDNDDPVPYHYPDWMSGISDDTYLSMITIPGTHDTGADTHTSKQGAGSWETICHDYRLSNQLEIGVRFFDIRYDINDGEIHHGPYNLNKTFYDMLAAAQNFLSAHPKETVVFLIKQENSKQSDATFSRRIWIPISAFDLNKFYLGDVMPKLGDVRGKLVIMRHDNFNDGGHPLGAPLGWPDNTTGYYGSSNHFIFFVQDHYKLTSVNYDIKCNEIRKTIDLAHNYPDPNRLNLNFTSGEKDGIPAHYLRTVAANINQNIQDYLIAHADWNNCGVIMLNFAGGSDEKDGNGNRTVAPDLARVILMHNEFASVKIGSQVWTGTNLAVTKYRNGDPIPKVTDNTAWTNLTTGAYCESPYGLLYNWYAVNDPRKLAPAGWHIPTQGEWNTLVNSAGGEAVAAGRLKDIGNLHWKDPNAGATNELLFRAYPAGFRDWAGTMFHVGETTVFWTSTPISNDRAVTFQLFNNEARVLSQYDFRNEGLSVRCVKD